MWTACSSSPTTIASGATRRPGAHDFSLKPPPQSGNRTPQHSQGEAAPSGTVLALVLLCLALFHPFGAIALGAEGILDADDALRLANQNKVTIVDVRSQGEWQQSGIPAGAARVTIHNRRGPQGFLEEILKLTGGKRDAPLAMICARGTRSSAAAHYLRGQGFSNIYDISVGMLGRDDRPGWLKRGLPIESCGACP